MAKSKEFIQKSLVNYTNASSSTVEVKNNRYHYMLSFNESIGWDWFYSQIKKCSAEVETKIEPYKIRPGGTIEVREIERREGIDNNQRGLNEW